MDGIVSCIGYLQKWADIETRVNLEIEIEKIKRKLIIMPLFAYSCKTRLVGKSSNLASFYEL